MKALANSEKPTIRGPTLPCPGLVTATANTTDTCSSRGLAVELGKVAADCVCLGLLSA